jgi:septum site-determining protein MinC
MKGEGKGMEVEREKPAVTLKGGAGHLRLVVPEGLADPEVWPALEKAVVEAHHLLAGGRVVLDLQGRPLSESFIGRMLTDVIWNHGLNVLSWISFDNEGLGLLRKAGLAVGEPMTTVPETRQARSCQALLVDRSLRSGQKVEHPGDVFIVGQVNDGAEVISGGNIVVWGRLQGLVHAGVEGNVASRVIAKSFEATQVRIGRLFSTFDSASPWYGKSVLFAVEGDTLIARELP